MLEPVHRLRGVIGLAMTQLWRNPSRSMLAVVGIALAVLATTLLMSVGAGVVDTGQQKFDQSGRDLWVTGGAVTLSPGSATPIENTVLSSHRIAREIEQRNETAVATPMAFQGVYAGKDPDQLRLITAVGVPKAPGGKAISVSEGRGFTKGDIHYANGTYEGPMTYNAVIGPRTASLLNASVGDSIYVGGSKASARAHEFEVVGISASFGRFLGTPTVTLHLSELQEVTGTTGTDRATFIAVRLQDGVSPAAAKADLQAAYPQYRVRTNREQFQRILEQKAVVIASGSALVLLAIVSGLALTTNLLALVVQQQRTELAALEAIGLSRWTLVGIVGTQGVLLGVLGGGAGLALTPITAGALNSVAAHLVGFNGLLQTPSLVYVAGSTIAVLVGGFSAMVAAWKLLRTVDTTDISR